MPPIIIKKRGEPPKPGNLFGGPLCRLVTRGNTGSVKQFSVTQAIGQAGEYLVGAVVAHELAWPYRMQPIADIGIDGEIEVLNESVSTHGLLKVQVKAENADQDGAPSNEYVSHEDFEYWTLLALPVILCAARS